MKNFYALLGATLIGVSVSAQCLTISCNSNVVVNNDPGTCGAVVNYTTLTVLTNTCSGSQSDTFQFTGAQQTFTVPPGITSVNIQTWGAQGGANWVNNVNYGGYVAGDIAVTPGEVLNVYVGGQPTTIAGGFNGGGGGEGVGKGGGGASDVRQGGNTYSNRVIVAGGAGGAGYWSNLHVVGGVGGGLNGGNGYRDPNYATNPGGQGGGQSASGNGTCVSFNNPAMAGGFGYGGTSSGCGCEGYGGGGGWYGGAASGNCRGGGGGSGYAIPGATNVVMNSGVRIGNGRVIISYAITSTTGVVNQTAGLASGATFPVGVTTNIFIGDDGFGNSDTCTFTVNVADIEAPVINGAPTAIAMNNDFGMCGANVSWTSILTNDNCSATISMSANSGDFFPIGVTTVSMIATDPSGNADTATWTVTVTDNESPVITNVPINISQANDSGQCGAIVMWSGPSILDNCSGVITNASSNPGDFFPVGTTTVIYIATDSTGNSDTASFTVTINDTEPPVVTCPANITVSTDAGMCSASNVNLGSVIATDNCSTTVTNDAPVVFSLGLNIVTYSATDAGGNTTTCTQTVTVIDNQPPVITCSQDIIMCPGVVQFGAPVATDNCNVNLTQVSGPLTGTNLAAGTYTVVYVVSDSSGNSDTCSFVITVNPNPTITMSNPNTVCVTDGNYTLNATPAGGTWSGTAITGNSFSPSTAGNGLYTIMYSYTDANGCSAQGLDTINVLPCTGINEAGVTTFSLFPNPATTGFTFTSAEHGTVEIFDAAGKVVIVKAISNAQTEIATGELAGGLYLVRFTSVSGVVSTAQLQVQQ